MRRPELALSITRRLQRGEVSLGPLSRVDQPESIKYKV